MNLKIKWKDALAHLPFWFKKKRKKKEGEMSLLINLKKIIFGEMWGMSDTCKTENFWGLFIKT